MVIAYDYQIFAAQAFGGISRYHCALARELGRIPGVRARIIAPLHSNAHLRAVASPTAVGCYIPRLPLTGRVVAQIDALLFRAVTGWLRPDVVHETHYAARPTSRGTAARVVTVHDMTHVRFARDFPASDKTAVLQARAVARADRIICVSEHTRRDLLKTHSIDPARVAVVHHGFDELRAGTTSARALVGPMPYLLFVGTRGHYKNFAGLVRALALSAWLRSNLRIVCFGGGPFSTGERALLAESKLRKEQVVQLSGGDDQLAALYGDAEALVYPSRHEGFGMPLLEAMSLGCPVVCSDRSSMPEVAGCAAEYFDPESPEAMALAIESVLQSPSRRAELIALGRARCARFSWTHCAEATLAVYRNLAG